MGMLLFRAVLTSFPVMWVPRMAGDESAVSWPPCRLRPGGHGRGTCWVDKRTRGEPAKNRWCPVAGVTMTPASSVRNAGAILW